MAEGPKTVAQASLEEDGERKKIDDKEREKTLEKRREEILQEIKKKLLNIKAPRNVLILGQLGVGKSSFINTVTSVLNGKFEYIAPTGSGDRHVSTTYRRYTLENYWKPKNKDDKNLPLPTFIDVSGLDEQLSQSRQRGNLPNSSYNERHRFSQTNIDEISVNKQVVELIVQGKLPDNCDLMELSKNLRMGRKMEKTKENKGMAVDIIIVVISGETMEIPKALLDDIYAEANLNKTKIPVFGVMTKADKIDESVDVQQKTKGICHALSIDEEHFLMCRCYQSEKTKDLENDIKILEFFSKLCNRHITAYEISKMKFRDPAESSGGYFWMLLIAEMFVLVLAAFFPLIWDRWAKFINPAPKQT